MAAANWRTVATLASGAMIAACVPAGSPRPAVLPPAEVVTAAPPAPAAAPLRNPAPAPALAARPVTRNAVMAVVSSYVVQRGDTLRGIGNSTFAGSEAIARANNLTAPYVLRPGQRLIIPPGAYHSVEAGQTGIAIARAYGVSWDQIIRDNALEPPFTLRIGQRLRLPEDAAIGARMPSVEEQAAAFTLDIDDIMTGAQPAQAAAAAPVRAAPATPGAAAAGSAAAFRWPASGRIVGRFGPAGVGRVNNGIDIATATAAPVQAARDGTVLYAGSDVSLLGGLILIDHGDGWVSAYGHLDRVAVRQGERVAAGAQIGTVGANAHADGPQLHFELRRNRQPIDPLRHLPPQ